MGDWDDLDDLLQDLNNLAAAPVPTALGVIGAPPQPPKQQIVQPVSQPSNFTPLPVIDIDLGELEVSPLMPANNPPKIVAPEPKPEPVIIPAYTPTPQPFSLNRSGSHEPNNTNSPPSRPAVSNTPIPFNPPPQPQPIVAEPPKNEPINATPKLQMSASVDKPKGSTGMSEADYKKMMIEKYEQQQQENARTLRKMKKEKELVERFGPQVFGAMFHSVRPHPENDTIPIIVEETIRVLEQKGLREEGIFRLAGNATLMKQIKEQFDKGQTPDLNRVADIHSVSSLLKTFFRELQDTPFSTSTKINTADPLPSIVDACNNDIMREWDEIRYNTFKRLFGILSKVSQNQDQTKMGASNLGLLFMPTLHVPVETLVAMINHYDYIFEGKELPNSQSSSSPLEQTYGDQSMMSYSYNDNAYTHESYLQGGYGNHPPQPQFHPPQPQFHPPQPQFQPPQPQFQPPPSQPPPQPQFQAPQPTPPPSVITTPQAYQSPFFSDNAGTDDASNDLPSYDTTRSAPPKSPPPPPQRTAPVANQGLNSNPGPVKVALPMMNPGMVMPLKQARPLPEKASNVPVPAPNTVAPNPNPNPVNPNPGTSTSPGIPKKLVLPMGGPAPALKSTNQPPSSQPLNTVPKVGIPPTKGTLRPATNSNQAIPQNPNPVPTPNPTPVVTPNPTPQPQPPAVNPLARAVSPPGNAIPKTVQLPPKQTKMVQAPVIPQQQPTSQPSPQIPRPQPQPQPPKQTVAPTPTLPSTVAPSMERTLRAKLNQVTTQTHTMRQRVSTLSLQKQSAVDNEDYLLAKELKNEIAQASQDLETMEQQEQKILKALAAEEMLQQAKAQTGGFPEPPSFPVTAPPPVLESVSLGVAGKVVFGYRAVGHVMSNGQKDVNITKGETCTILGGAKHGWTHIINAFGEEGLVPSDYVVAT